MILQSTCEIRLFGEYAVKLSVYSKIVKTAFVFSKHTLKMQNFVYM